MTSRATFPLARVTETDNRWEGTSRGACFVPRYTTKRASRRATRRGIPAYRYTNGRGRTCFR